MKNKAQIELSYKMIMSILLIAVFIVFAVYASKLFIDAGDEIKNLQNNQVTLSPPCEDIKSKLIINNICFKNNKLEATITTNNIYLDSLEITTNTGDLWECNNQCNSCGLLFNGIKTYTINTNTKPQTASIKSGNCIIENINIQDC